MVLISYSKFLSVNVIMPFEVASSRACIFCNFSLPGSAAFVNYNQVIHKYKSINTIMKHTALIAAMLIRDFILFIYCNNNYY